MCGLIGGFGRTPALPQAMTWVARRGPDGGHLWKSVDGHVTLGHTRLAIVDRDPRADQPFCSTDGQIAVALVGEIYNHQELRRQLRSFPFRSLSDTEIVLAVYHRHGPKGLRKLKGMFALVIVDQRRRRVLLVRDAVGKKPLYVSRWGGQVLFGSSVLALQAGSAHDAAIDSRMARHYWEKSFVAPMHSLLEDSQPVLPGQMLELDWNGEVVGVNCVRPKSEKLFEGESFEQAVRHVGELLDTAVSRRLDNNPKPTTLLSGGIDSTVVTAVLSRAVGDGQAITLGSMIPGTNDERFAHRAARRLGLPLRVVRPAFGVLGDTVISAIDLQDEPLGMPSFFLLERLVHAASRYGRVLLSGDGGDEIFVGYGIPSDWLKRNEEGNTSGGSDFECGPPVPSWAGPWAKDVMIETLVGHMFAKVDRASAEQGVELRCPLLDCDVVAYARSLPFDYLTHGGRTKAMLKALLPGWGRSFLERPKLGFAYNLRWLWGLRGFSGFSEHVTMEAVNTFEQWLPGPLARSPTLWRRRDMFQFFPLAWQLLVWSRFLVRQRRAQLAVPRTLDACGG